MRLSAGTLSWLRLRAGRARMLETRPSVVSMRRAALLGVSLLLLASAYGLDRWRVARERAAWNAQLAAASRAAPPASGAEANPAADAPEERSLRGPWSAESAMRLAAEIAHAERAGAQLPRARLTREPSGRFTLAVLEP
ncbi:MAG: hypothetical protein NZ533_09180 [Casimicrobiaceae bacterium]|nr:hypothetical protein [Casimicrobiaceae bacterium]MDW8312197.1 hypothetical protein [Burkholderiales bacterium]